MLPASEEMATSTDNHEMVLAALNELHGAVTQLPCSTSISVSAVDDLRSKCQRTSEILSALFDWESRHSQLVKLTQETRILRNRNKAAVASLRSVHRAIHDEMAARAGTETQRFIAMLSRFAQEVSNACHPDELELYVPEEEEEEEEEGNDDAMVDSNGTNVCKTLTKSITVTLYCHFMALDISVREAPLGVECTKCNLQFSQSNGDTVSDDEIDQQIKDITVDAIKGQPKRLCSVLLALTRTEAAAQQLGHGTIGDQSLAFVRLGQALREGFAQIVPTMGCAPKKIIEGLELRLWPTPLGDGVGSTEPPLSSHLLRLAPASWRQQPAVAAVLSRPIVISVHAAKILFSVALHIGAAMMKVSGAESKTAGEESYAALFPDNVWEELLAANCFDISSIGSGIEDGYVLRPQLVLNEEILPPNISVSSLSTRLCCTVLSIAPPSKIVSPAVTVGTLGTTLGGLSSPSAISNTKSSELRGHAPLRSGRFQRPSDALGQEFVVLRWIPVVDEHANLILPSVYHYLRATIATQALATSHILSPESYGNTKDMMSVDRTIAATILPQEIPLRKTNAPMGGIGQQAGLLISLSTIDTSSDAASSLRPDQESAHRIFVTVAAPPGLTYDMDALAICKKREPGFCTEIESQRFGRVAVHVVDGNFEKIHIDRVAESLGEEWTLKDITAQLAKDIQLPNKQNRDATGKKRSFVQIQP